MKPFILSFIVFLSQQVLAGAPGHGGFFCESKSERTKVTVIDRYGDGVTILFSIDGSSTLYEADNSPACQDDCMWIDTQGHDNGVSYLAKSGDYTNWEMTITGENAVIKKGFIDPRNYTTFNSNIDLKCKAVEQEI